VRVTESPDLGCQRRELNLTDAVTAQLNDVNAALERGLEPLRVNFAADKRQPGIDQFLVAVQGHGSQSAKS